MIEWIYVCLQHPELRPSSFISIYSKIFRIKGFILSSDFFQNPNLRKGTFFQYLLDHLCKIPER
jgi:hypothetical protein